MRRVFLDTVGLIALWEENDQWHAPARQALAAFSSPDLQFVTTSLILLDCGNAAARKPYRRDVEQLWRRMVLDCTLIEPTAQELDQGWQDFATGAAGDAGIVDHISFIVMRRLAITEAFTNDRHFRVAGFQTLF